MAVYYNLFGGGILDRIMNFWIFQEFLGKNCLQGVIINFLNPMQHSERLRKANKCFEIQFWTKLRRSGHETS